MGSIEMTDYERRQLAAQSLESNIRDEHFCELFSELAMVMHLQTTLCQYFSWSSFLIFLFCLFIENSKRNRKTKFGPS